MLLAGQGLSICGVHHAELLNNHPKRCGDHLCDDDEYAESVSATAVLMQLAIDIA